MDITFVTGNQNKADFLARHLNLPIKHKKLELDEMQSLNLKEIAEHKARQAYAQLDEQETAKYSLRTSTMYPQLKAFFTQFDA
jgi:hypothetical protein